MTTQGPRSTSSTEIDHQRIRALFEQTGFRGNIDRIDALTGDASLRRYFRLTLSEGDQSSIIATLLPEHTTGEIGASCPADRFGAVSSLFEAAGLPVPQVSALNDRANGYLQQDLGDRTLADEVVESPQMIVKRYGALISYLPVLENLKTDFKLPVCDHAMLHKEWVHFIDEIMATTSIKGCDHAKALTAELSTILAAGPQRTAHRDYHARNVMIHQGRTILIDYQDLFVAPAGYDLVSLTRDAYVDFSESDRQRLEAMYDCSWQDELPPQVSGHPLWLDLIGAQRNLKAAGRFAWFKRVRGDASYMPAVPRLLRIATTALNRCAVPQAAELSRWILAQTPIAPAAETTDLIPETE